MNELIIDITIEVSGRGMATHATAKFKLPERVYARLERTIMDDLLQTAVDGYYEMVADHEKKMELEARKDN